MPSSSLAQITLSLSGLFAIYGAVRTELRLPALVVSSVLYLTYGLSRLVSVIADGMPSGAMVQVIGLELVLAALCLAALVLERSQGKLAKKDMTMAPVPRGH